METVNLKIQGHVIIKDPESGEIFVNKRNAIHYENMSYAIASLLSVTPNANGLDAFVYDLAFGNGGVVVDSTGNVTYNATKTTNIADSIYNETFNKVVYYDAATNTTNNTTLAHTTGDTYSDLVINCLLDYNEPSTQDALDNTADQEGAYVFDEIGIRSQQGRLLTHLIFHPIQKSANRKIQIIYTIRFSIG